MPTPPTRRPARAGRPAAAPADAPRKRILSELPSGLVGEIKQVAKAGLQADVSDEVRAECAVVGASALADTGRLDDALAFIRRFPSRAGVGRPFDLRVWYVAGDILARLGRDEEAAAEFARVIRHDPSAFDAADRLARLGH